MDPNAIQTSAARISQPRKGVNVTILKRTKIPNATNTIRQYCQFEPVRLFNQLATTTEAIVVASKANAI